MGIWRRIGHMRVSTHKKMICWLWLTFLWWNRFHITGLR